MPYAKKAAESKELGNTCMKDGHHTEAIIHYTQALNFDPSNHLVYSNRSLAFLKEQQYYLALEDAKRCIQLQPKWPKGYFRKGEIEFQAFHFEMALQSYQHALSLDPSDEGIKTAVHKAANELERSRIADAKVPWSFTVIGALVGVLVVLVDEFCTQTPALMHFLLKIAFVGICGALGAIAARGYRYVSENQKKSLLEPPPDLLVGGVTKKTADSTTKSKAAAGSNTTRHRGGHSTQI